MSPSADGEGAEDLKSIVAFLNGEGLRDRWAAETAPPAMNIP
jgi:hypothetical protein